jgi:hypothetical protein
MKLNRREVKRFQGVIHLHRHSHHITRELGEEDMVDHLVLVVVRMLQQEGEEEVSIEWSPDHQLQVQLQQQQLR